MNIFENINGLCFKRFHLGYEHICAYLFALSFEFTLVIYIYCNIV